MMTTQWWDIAPLGWNNILACLVCGGLVGLERQLHGKPVGMPTSASRWRMSAAAERA